jgi:hypothetical protein
MKYKLTENFKLNAFGTKLFQIKCVTEIKSKGVKVGDLGGWIEAEKNLSQEGDAWVFGNAEVSGNARVSGDAWVSGKARVSGDAKVSGNALVSGDAKVSGDARVSGDAEKKEKSLKNFSNEELLSELLSREECK